MIKSNFLRSALAAIAVLACGTAFAQRALGGPQQGGAPADSPSEQIVVPQMGEIKFPAAVVDDTRNYFPQVNTALRQKPIRPENPRPNVETKPGASFGLKYMGGSTEVPSRLQIGTRFPGISFTGSIPPDPDIAVGPDHVVQVVNGGVAFYDKETGAAVFQQPDSNTGFWSGIGAPGFIFDPKAFFDPISERFFIVELALNIDNVGNITSSRVLIAVSDDDDPNGTWFKYNLDSLFDIGGNKFWFDYPGFGADKDNVVITGNLFPVSAGGFGGTLALMVPKAPLLSGQPVTAKSFNPFVGTLQIGKAQDAATGAVFGVSRSFNSLSQLIIWRFTGSGSSASMVGSPVNIPTIRNFGFGEDETAPSKNGPRLDTITDRVMSTMVRSNRIFTTQTVRSASSPKSVVVWYEIDANAFVGGGAPTLTQTGQIELPDQEWAYQPSIGVNTSFDVAIVFTRSSPEIFADVMVASRAEFDPAGTVSAPKVVFSSTRNNLINAFRWGDYSDVEIDPLDNLNFWSTNEIIDVTGTWGTTIDKLDVPLTTPSKVANPPGASVLVGSLLGGTSASVATADRAYFEARSAFVAGAGEFAGVVLDFNLPFTKEKTRSFFIDVIALRRGGRRVTGMFFLYNFTANRWDYFSAAPLQTRDGAPFQVRATLDQVSDYASESGQVRLLIRSQEPLNRFLGAPRSHDLRVDFGQLTAFGR
jgi:hypothetical protein